MVGGGEAVVPRKLFPDHFFEFKKVLAQSLIPRPNSRLQLNQTHQGPRAPEPCSSSGMS